MGNTLEEDTNGTISNQTQQPPAESRNKAFFEDLEQKAKMVAAEIPYSRIRANDCPTGEYEIKYLSG